MAFLELKGENPFRVRAFRAAARAVTAFPHDLEQGLADATTLLQRAKAELPGGVSAFEVMWPSYLDFMMEKVKGLRAPLPGRHSRRRTSRRS